MPDWQELVRLRLSGLALAPNEKEEVHAELAAHLEESYEALRGQGLSEKDAALRTLEQVPDWLDLLRKIFVAKRREHSMQKRVHQLWIPGFLTLSVSMIFLMTLQRSGFSPRIVWSGTNAILLYVPWLLSLPFVGALGAYLSCRAGGSRRTVLLASVFPVFALTVAFLLMFPIGLIMEWIFRRHVDFGFVAIALLKDGIGWLLVPGAALLTGGLCALLLLPWQLVRRGIASN